VEKLLQQLREAYKEAKKRNSKRQVLQDIIINRKTGEFRFVFKEQTTLNED